MMNKRTFILSFALFMGCSLFAQHNEDVIIEGSYRPTVNKVDKILLKPQMPEQHFSMPGVEVNIKKIEHRFPLELDPLSAMSYANKNSQLETTTKNFLMAGFGTRLSPVFLYKHNSMITKNLGLGVGIKHYSTWLNMKNYGPSSMMNNALDISLTSSRYKNVQLGGDVYYKNDLYHYYGFHPGANVATDLEESTRQSYNTIGAHFGVASATTRLGELSHNADLDYHFMFDRFDALEHFTSLTYDLGYTQSWWGNKSHPQRLGLKMDLQNDYFQGYLNETTTATVYNNMNRWLIQLNPYFEMKDEFYHLHLGVKADMMNTRPQYGVYPDVKGSLFAFEKKVEFYAGVNGGRKLVTYRGLVEENPFLGREIDTVSAPTVKLGFEGGVRTNVMETMDIHVGVRYRHTDDDLFFVPVNGTSVVNPLGENHAFGVCGDESRLVSVLANVRWLAMDKLVIDAGFAFNKYKLKNLAHAYYRPMLEGDLKVSYDVTDRLALNGTFLYQGERWGAFILNGIKSVKMKDVFDLGLGADYKFGDQLTVFAKLENLANQKYQLYYDYPVTGIQFFAGVKMRF